MDIYNWIAQKITPIAAVCLALLFCLPAWAQPKAVIEGPAEADPGDLVVLRGTESTGDGFRWVMPEGLGYLQCSPLEIGFASGTPGQYTFWLIAADTEAAIDYTQHTVTIGEPPPDDPGQPGDPPPDDPAPAPPQGIEQLSRQQAEALNDPRTSAALSAAINGALVELEGMCRRGQCPGLATAKSVMVSTVQRTLARRQGASQLVNWLDGWRVPMNAALEPIQMVPDYLAAMRAAANGLAAAGQ